MNNHIHMNFNNNKTVAAKEGPVFFGILVMFACCLCCINGTGGNFSCT